MISAPLLLSSGSMTNSVLVFNKFSNRHLPYNEIDILSPIEGTYQNNNLFYFPESYERLEGSATIRVVVFVAEGLGFVVQL
jgi:hypothetical protein